MQTKLPTLLVAFVLIGLISCSSSTLRLEKSTTAQDRTADDVVFEEAQTAKLLGVPLQKFPAPQGLSGMDEIPATAPPFSFILKSQPVSGPPPRVSFEERKIVKAVAPDGSIYEAYCGHDNDS